MAKEYIDREEALSAIKQAFEKGEGPSLYIKREAAIEAAKHAWAKGIDPVQYMEIIPAADVGKVVRCKDCLYSTERYGHMECIHGVSYRNTWNKPDFFCSYGERKEGADNEP